MRIFLGGTCAGWDWRKELIEKDVHFDYFNPIVEDWTPECIKREEEEKEKCDILLFMITKDMKGVYSIAEAVDASNKTPKKVVFIVYKEGFDDFEMRSLRATGKIISRNRAIYIEVNDIEELRQGLNFLSCNLN